MSFKHWKGLNSKNVLLILQYKGRPGHNMWNLSWGLGTFQRFTINLFSKIPNLCLLSFLLNFLLPEPLKIPITSLKAVKKHSCVFFSNCLSTF